MSAVLPWMFALLGGVALVGSVLALWQSLRSAFGAVGDEAGAAVSTSEQRDTLLDEKNALLRSIKDLEFERDVGKISKDDYERLDAKMRGRAREVLRLLDEDVEPYRGEAERLVAERLNKVEGATPYRSPAPDAKAETEAEVEAETETEAKVESEAETEAETEAKAEAEAESESAPARAPEPESGTEAEAERLACPSCETDNEPDATFCKKCGARVAGDGEEAES